MHLYKAARVPSVFTTAAGEADHDAAVAQNAQVCCAIKVLRRVTFSPSIFLTNFNVHIRITTAATTSDKAS